MSNMLVVTTMQFCDPVAFRVKVEADNGLEHGACGQTFELS